MADFMTAVKSIRTHREDAPQDSLLEAIKSTDQKQQPAREEETQQHSQNLESVNSATVVLESAEDALHILRSRPDITQLVAALHKLSSRDIYFESGAPFSLHDPGPIQAQILSALLSNIVPNFWPVLSSSQRSHLIACLQNVAGLNATIARLRLLSSQKIGATEHDGSQTTKDVLDLSRRLFTGDEIILKIWQQLQDAVANKVKRALAWKEFVNLVASGKVTSCVAQAEDSVKDLSDKSWLASGSEYTKWLGTNIASVTLAKSSGHIGTNAGAQLFAKALTFGYPDQLLQSTFRKLVRADVESEAQNPASAALISALPLHAKRIFIEHLLHWLSSLMSSVESDEPESRDSDVLATAGFIRMVLHDELVRQHITSSFTDPAVSSSLSFPLRRACLAALASWSGDDLQTILDKSMSIFANSLFIKHNPILQQETLAQMLLLVAGYVHRQTPMALLVIARSTSHMQGVSNRLDASNARARWLGMVVGTAVSSLVDREGSQMSFGTEEMETDEAKWYTKLVFIEDTPSTLSHFDRFLQSQLDIKKPRIRKVSGTKTEKVDTLNGKPVFGPLRPPAQTEVIGEKVTEILDYNSEDDDDLKPYAKPDSDPEDSDEDATLVTRNRVRPPVYIRDLMSMLRDGENHDRFQLAIKHAASLIRRKSNFGAEVKDHANELAAILCNLQDPFSTEDFDELKLQALIAVLLSDVRAIAPWLSKQAFAGDYSVAQRCIILSALGLGGRELAGLKNEDELNPALANTDFPSKRLPPHLHATYTAPVASTKRLEAATKSMEHTLINPLALQAADQSTGHLNAVKVRTFSSRLDAERTKRKPAPNQLAKVFGERFFFPLSNRYQQEVAAYSSASVFASVPIVLVTFVKTLSLLLHASGPATIGLPQILEEFWDLLLSLRVKASTDISILQSVLFGLLTLLEVSYDKQRIAEDCPKQLMETQRWTDLIFERTGGSELVSETGNEDEVKVRTLAAGVLVKTREVIHAYQKQLVGYAFD